MKKNGKKFVISGLFSVRKLRRKGGVMYYSGMRALRFFNINHNHKLS